MSDQSGFTRLPNEIIEAMPYLGNGELRVLLAIARKTIGYQKERDRISVSQIEKLTGLAHRHALSALKSLIERGYIGQEQTGKQRYEYFVKPVPLGNQSPTGTSTPREPEPVPLGNQFDEKPVPLGNTQKKDLKERKKRGDARARATHPPKQQSLNSFSESVQIYKELTGLKTLAPVIADKIAEIVVDCQHWRTTLTAWLGAGYSAKNTDGLLDWYLDPSRMERRNGQNGIRAQGSSVVRQPANAVIPNRPPSAAAAAFERDYFRHIGVDPDPTDV